jgi:SpoIID/LytB domain protein
VTDADLERASAGRTIALGSPGAGGRVATIALEAYVARVLAGEAERDAPDGELQALAVAVRTFAIFNAGRHRRDGFDLCDTTHCQVPRTPTAATRRAALATAGRILTYKGAPAEIFYSASCGGRSESASVVWPGTNAPYLTSVVDDVHDDDEPWTLELTLAQIQSVLRGIGFDGSRLADIRIEDRSASGRVTRLGLNGLHPDAIAGEAFRAAIGAAKLRSTAFSMTRQGSTVRFTGRGYGHGVGLCVIGAGRRARRGETWEEILAKYFPGLRLAPLDRVTPAVVEPALVTKAKEPAVTSTPASSGIVAHVPKGSPVTAAQIERDALRLHQALSQVLGTSVTPLTIELHESIDRFRETTGRPWWVSSATKGTAIDLPPVAVLEQRDGLETALAQAMAEIFVTPALAQRPVWVRVGAARYFAREARADPNARTAARPSSSPARCPSDAELTLAISAAAQRDADARAEACFARAYARTKDWRAVR